MKDWMIRALKTFVQAFFGVLIPAICTMLSGGWPESWNAVWVVLAPTVAAALAAAIAAVWNIILEEMKEDKKDTPEQSENQDCNEEAEQPNPTTPGKHEILTFDKMWDDMGH